MPTAKPRTRVPSAGWRAVGDRSRCQCDEVAKLGSDHHGADNEDRLVEHDPDVGDHGRHDHEA
jgi:hypothetical protein